MVLDTGKDGVEGTGIQAPKGKHGSAGIIGTATIEEITGADKMPSLDGVTISDNSPSHSAQHAPSQTQGSDTSRLDVELAARRASAER